MFIVFVVRHGDTAVQQTIYVFLQQLRSCNSLATDVHISSIRLLFVCLCSANVGGKSEVASSVNGVGRS